LQQEQVEQLEASLQPQEEQEQSEPMMPIEIYRGDEALKVF